MVTISLVHIFFKYNVNIFFSVMPNEVQTVKTPTNITEPLSTEPGMYT